MHRKEEREKKKGNKYYLCIFDYRLQIDGKGEILTLVYASTYTCGKENTILTLLFAYWYCISIRATIL